MNNDLVVKGLGIRGLGVRGIEWSSQMLCLQPRHKYFLLGRLSKEVGWHHYDTITELEGKRKVKAQVSYEKIKKLAKLRSKAVELAEKKLAPEKELLASIKY